MLRLLVFTLTGVLVGCAPQASPTAQRSSRPPPARVALLDSEAEVSDCTFLAEVTVQPPLALLRQSYPELTFMAREDLERSLRREAQEAGGNAVLTTGVEEGQMRGRAYECDS